MAFLCKKTHEFDCCSHLSTVKKYLRVVEDQCGNKLQLWVNERIAKKIDEHFEKYGSSCTLTIKKDLNEGT